MRLQPSVSEAATPCDKAATLCDPGGLLLLACAADPEPWLGEMRDLVEEVREAHFPELRLVATTLSDDDVAPWSPGPRTMTR